MSKEIVLDIETFGDIRNYDSLKVTMCSIYEYEHDTYRSFDEHQLADLWPILEQAERIIGYNSDHFDLPILNRFYTGDLMQFPSLDLLKVIKEINGKRYKLDDVAQATLQIAKSADGLQAVRWYEEGKIDEIREYCEQDVKVTKEVYEFGKSNKMLYVKTLTGELQPISVDFSEDATPALSADGGGGTNINLTLPL